MDGEGMSRLYDRVVSGCKIIQDRGQIYVVRDPFSFDRQLAMLAYDTAFQAYQLNGVPSLDGVQDLLIKQRIWGGQHLKFLTQLQEQKKDLRKEIRECEFKSLSRAAAQTKLDEVERKIKKLLRQKNYLSNTSAEYFAKIEFYKTLLFRSVYDIDGKRVWATRDEFDRADENLVSLLIKDAYLNDEIGESEIRLMARSEPWRSCWLGAVKTGRFLDRPLSEATDLQRAAIQWSIIYDNAFESSEPPTAEILNDDSLFDAWMEEQSAKRKAGDSHKDKFAHLSGEVGIVVETPEDAKKVYEMNGILAKKAVTDRFKAVKEKGMIPDSQLPDVKLRNQMEVNRNLMNAANKR